MSVRNRRDDSPISQQHMYRERERATGNSERAFLVGIEFRSRKLKSRPSPATEPEGAGASTRSQAVVLQAARQARTAALAPRESASADAIPFDADESLAELRELTTSAGGTIVGELLQRRDRPDPATLIGSGKLEELAAIVESTDADIVIFDHDLTPSQQRNLERQISARVVDRTQLILDIFARHARTREGQLQVELAQLEYMLPRLGGRGIEMSQLGGGIGTRGPGETQLETDRRKIHRRIRHIKEQLEDVRRIRAQQRQRRESVPVEVVALVGYTNAGKSTLFNLLTHAGVIASSRMFATLDPTLRSVRLPSRREVLFSDTVGFIRNLPHTLVSAFRATLEEVQRASLLLHVTDVTSPTAAEQMAQVESVLRELEVGDKPRILVMNKTDLLPQEKRASLIDSDSTVHISAAKKLGIDALLETIDRHLQQDPICAARLQVPQSEGKALAMLEGRSRIRSREYVDGAVQLEVEAPESLLRELREFVVPEPRTRRMGRQKRKA